MRFDFPFRVPECLPADDQILRLDGAGRENSTASLRIELWPMKMLQVFILK